jgi:tRNA (cytidine32/uridine32-2'-O)-methyltransferase
VTCPSPDIRIVLLQTSHPGNIGAVARAMKNMCLRDLWLVAPRRFPDAEATARASGADDVLAGARVCASLDEALAGCRLVIGTSARRRTVEWPLLDPRQCAGTALAAAREGPVALLFGRENSGLSNEELDRCRYLVHIPSNPDYNSLNLAMAVQVLAYEMLMASGELRADVPERHPATADRFEGMMNHLAETLHDIRYADVRHSPKLMRRLRRLFLRAEPDDDEVNILRGILSAAQGMKTGCAEKD